MIAGLPGVGLGSLFYAALLVGMGVAKLSQIVLGCARRVCQPPPELQPAAGAVAGEREPVSSTGVA